MSKVSSTQAKGSAPKTIVHVVFRFDYGGMENGVVNLINASDPARFRHVVIALTDVTEFAQRIQSGRAQLIALNKRPGKDLPMYWRLYRALRRVRPDIYHSRNFGTLDTVPIARLAGVRDCIHGEHGWDVHDPDGTRAKYRYVRRAVLPLVRRVVCVSEQLRDWLTDTVGIRSHKTAHICNGVDTEKFAPADKILRRQALLPQERFPADAIVVGGVGRFESIKDPLNLVEAFVALAKSDADDRQHLRLLYIGDGALRQQALDRLAEAGLTKRAWLPGSRDDVPALFHCMDMFVLPSLREGISNTILEAMASGLPVIATRTGGNPELIRDGETGYLVPVGDSQALAAAISRYVDDAACRQHHASEARKDAVDRLSLSTMVSNYEALYDSMAGA